MAYARFNRPVSIRYRLTKNAPKLLFLLFLFVILTSFKLTNLANLPVRDVTLDNEAASISLRSVHQKVTIPKLIYEVKIVQETVLEKDNVEIDAAEEMESVEVEYEIIECFDYPSSVFEDYDSRNARVVREADDREQIEQENISKFLNTPSCPVCFGKAQCKEIRQNFKVTNTEKQRNSLVEINGIWEDEPVTLINFGNTDKFKELDDVIHTLYQEEQTYKDRENVTLKQFVNNFSVKNLHNLTLEYIFTNISNNIISSYCVNTRLLQKLLKLFTGETSNQPDYAVHTGYFVTTWMLKPDIIIYRFIDQYVPKLRDFLPAFYGVCGRGFVIGNDGTPLYQFLSSPWATRVRLAIQLLDFIERLIYSSSEWEIIIFDLDLNSFVVTSKGQLVLADFSSVVIVDKTQASEHGDEPPPAACNKQCLSKIIFQLNSSTTLCRRYSLRHYGHVMFLRACASILTDNYEKEQDQRIGGKGLLHDPPVVGQESYVSKLLASCINESSFRVRDATLKELRHHLLKQFIVIRPD